MPRRVLPRRWRRMWTPWRSVVVFAPLSFKTGWGRVIAGWAVVTWGFFSGWRVFSWTRVFPLTRTRGKSDCNYLRASEKTHKTLTLHITFTCVFFSPFSCSFSLCTFLLFAPLLRTVFATEKTSSLLLLLLLCEASERRGRRPKEGGKKEGK